ncbi:MAG: DUF4331 family protein [Chloroflexi bacterium]|nr:DUF4331 family protein [Chloroflexota bacterium]
MAESKRVEQHVPHHLDPALAHLDINDVYLFRGEIGTVFVLSVNSSAAGSDTPAGFDADTHYDFRIDLNGDAIEELTYRVIFGQLDPRGHQPLELYQLVGLETRDHTATGSLLAWGSTDALVSGSQGLRVWAGLAAESSYVEPTVLEAVCRAIRFGRRVELGAWQARRAVNAFAGTTVYAIVLEIPDCLFGELIGLERQIGFWGTTTSFTDGGSWRPIHRRGLPLVQSLFNPADDDERTSDYHTTHPADDRANYGELFASLVAAVVAAHETADDPLAYGATVARLLLPDVLTYQLGSPASFSFAGRNGRALTDNAPEVMFSLVTNQALSDGLGKRQAAGTPRPRFPYVPIPPSLRGLPA